MNSSLYSNCEKDFLMNSIVGKKRFDGRRLCDNQRLSWCFFIGGNTIHIMIGNSLVQCFGSSEFRHDHSTFRSNESNLMMKGEINPMLLSYFDLKRNKEYLTSAAKSFEVLLQDKPLFIPGSLSHNSDLVNDLLVSVHVINCDGIVINMLSLSLFLLLKLLYQPLMIIKCESTSRTNVDHKSNSFLLSQFPFCFSFCVINNLSLSVHGPSYIENIIMSGNIVTGVNIDNEIVSLKLIGSVTVTLTNVFQCCSIAFSELEVYRSFISSNFEQLLIGNSLVCDF